jgi:hypothetical protein
MNALAASSRDTCTRRHPPASTTKGSVTERERCSCYQANATFGAKQSNQGNETGFPSEEKGHVNKRACRPLSFGFAGGVCCLPSRLQCRSCHPFGSRQSPTWTAPPQNRADLVLPQAANVSSSSGPHQQPLPSRGFQPTPQRAGPLMKRTSSVGFVA